MVSLLKLATITEEGVRFLSPHDGTPMYASAAQILLLQKPKLPQALDTGTLDLASKFHRL